MLFHRVTSSESRTAHLVFLCSVHSIGAKMSTGTRKRSQQVIFAPILYGPAGMLLTETTRCIPDQTTLSPPGTNNSILGLPLFCYYLIRARDFKKESIESPILSWAVWYKLGIVEAIVDKLDLFSRAGMDQLSTHRNSW
jgi:hypothetical protein